MKTRYLFGLPFTSIMINNQEEVDVIIDTGFNGTVMLPLSVIKKLGLKRAGLAQYAMADGSISTSKIYSADFVWLKKNVTADIISSPSDLSLIGMELFHNARITLCPAENILTIGPLE